MSKEVITDNKIILSGEIVSELQYSHEVFEEKFYTAYLSSERTSGTSDILQVVISERLVDTNSKWIGQFVEIEGQIRSFRKRENDKSHLIISVFARELSVIDANYYMNYVELEGYICKEVLFRETPKGREIADTVIAVNRMYHKSDYIPSIFWGRNARFFSKAKIGTKVHICGRLQSREYIKKYEDGRQEVKTTYELSVEKATIIED